MNQQDVSRRWPLIVGAVVALVALGTGIFVATRTSVPDDAAFVYGDQVVTKSELAKRIDALQALYGISPPKGVKQRDTFQRTAAKAYAVTLILDRQAEKMDIEVSDKKARDLLDRYIDVQFGNRDEFVRVLGNVGTSERAVLTEIRRQAATMEMRRKVVGKVTVNDAALKAAFDRRRASLAIPEQRQLHNIVVESKAEADSIADRIRAGESVATLATELSIDSASNKAGGDLGFLSQEQLETSVGRAAFAAKKGDLYGPVKGEHGWNVGVVGDIRPPQPADFAVMGESFRTLLVQEQENARWTKWLTKVIKDADVHYAKAYQPADPDAPPPLGQSPIQSAPTQ